MTVQDSRTATQQDAVPTERFHALENSECPDCGSGDGYWQRGSVADFDYVCETCGGIFDQDTAERIARKPRTGDER